MTYSQKKTSVKVISYHVLNLKERIKLCELAVTQPSTDRRVDSSLRSWPFGRHNKAALMCCFDRLKPAPWFLERPSNADKKNP